MQNPCIVDRDVDLSLAARRITWAKFYNCGQTCIGVDYVLITRDLYPRFVEYVKTNIRSFYGADPKKSEYFPRVISKQHTQRLASLFPHGEVLCGGVYAHCLEFLACVLCGAGRAFLFWPCMFRCTLFLCARACILNLLSLLPRFPL